MTVEVVGVGGRRDSERDARDGGCRDEWLDHQSGLFQASPSSREERRRRPLRAQEIMPVMLLELASLGDRGIPKPASRPSGRAVSMGHKSLWRRASRGAGVCVAGSPPDIDSLSALNILSVGCVNLRPWT